MDYNYDEEKNDGEKLHLGACGSFLRQRNHKS